MNDFIFLTEEQCWGNNQLDILKIREKRAAITDFSILLGGYVSYYYIKSDSSLEGRTGYYWTRSDYRYDDADACAVDVDGLRYHYNVLERDGGARPALPFSSISKIPTNGVSGAPKKARDGVLEVEYGYYPQKAVSRDMQKKLEMAFQSKCLTLTGKKYTTDSRKYNAYDKEFSPKEHEEFQLDGKRYVRVEANSFFDGRKFKLSNGESYRDGDSVWLEVAPVKWLVDEKSKIMITDKIIFAGVQFKHTRGYHTEDFDKTDIKKFMDTYFSKEILRIRNEKIEEQIQNADADAKKTKKRENPYNFEFREVEEEEIIREAIRSNISIFLHGKPGCGKSDRVKQLDPDFIELNLSHLDPELLDGLAGEKNGEEVHIKPPWLKELEEKCKEEPNKIHILFLEEITNASQMMQSKAYGIALDKKVAGRWKLPENARVVAAGNEQEDSTIANEISQPLFDRFAHAYIETTTESWLQWAVTPEEYYERLDYAKEKIAYKMHPAIYAYISYRGEEVLRTPYDRENPKPHADPRRWKMASDMLCISRNPSTLRAIVGEEITRDFMDFCKIPTITVKDVIEGNYTEEEIKQMDLGRKLATVAGLLSVDNENMPKVREFVKKLGSEICRKFEVQWSYGNEERIEQLQEIKMEEQEAKESKENEEAFMAHI